MVKRAQMTEDELGFRLETYLAGHDFGDDASHDIHHARRVRALCRNIAQIEGAGDMLVLTAAAYLHDIVNLSKDHPDRASASTLAAEAAAPILRDCGLDEERIRQAGDAIRSHSFSAGFRPETLEARILQDADRQEALGAIGIARLFYVAGRLSSSLFDADDPLARNRALNDRRYALDHFAVKLFKLPDLMQTEGGRQLAQERVAFMQNFVSELMSELEP